MDQLGDTKKKEEGETRPAYREGYGTGEASATQVKNS
jgi:hypothetical protein